MTTRQTEALRDYLDWIKAYRKEYFCEDVDFTYFDFGDKDLEVQMYWYREDEEEPTFTVGIDRRKLKEIEATYILGHEWENLQVDWASA